MGRRGRLKNAVRNEKRQKELQQAAEGDLSEITPENHLQRQAWKISKMQTGFLTVKADGRGFMVRATDGKVRTLVSLTSRCGILSKLGRRYLWKRVHEQCEPGLRARQDVYIRLSTDWHDPNE